MLQLKIGRALLLPKRQWNFTTRRSMVTSERGTIDIMMRIIINSGGHIRYYFPDSVIAPFF